MRRLLVFAVALTVIGGLSWAGSSLAGGSGARHLTAYFDRTVGVYGGSDLRVLGVKVGTVDAVRPAGRRVRVELTLDEGHKVPAGARAVIVAPSVVSDRYIQLTPAYTGGAEMSDGTVIPKSRTAAPLEIDQLYDSVSDLTEALGPNGANADGALSGLLDTGAKNLDGNGEAMGRTVGDLGKAAKTLGDSSDELFDTLTYLQSFTSMLKKKDKSVRTAQERIAEVAGFLGEDKENLGGALKELGTALGQVKTFIRDNRGALKENVTALADLTQVLVDQRHSLAETLDTAPLATGNALKAYDPAHRTLDTRANIRELAGLPLPAVGGAYQEGGR
ncbi:MCE family protein [Streptomyces monticola]|uniref:MCE family protein n=1 Tax=Streptomyces monticola TaxID=2666263 RepID=A0ABW2JBP8_9ACTN